MAFMVQLLFLLLLRNRSVRADECETLRIENRLLRQLLAIQNEKEADPNSLLQGSEPKPSARPASVTPTWSVSSLTSTFPTTITQPVSTEILITLNGQPITTTIVDYETKETIGTSLIPTSVLVYPTAAATTNIASTSKKDLVIQPTKTMKTSGVQKTVSVPKFRASTSRPTSRPRPALRRKSSPKSFSVKTSRFGGFGSRFKKFKREALFEDYGETDLLGSY